nr:MAG TPA: N-deoxyribosyltransferase [Caudoviricetes sp.]
MKIVIIGNSISIKDKEYIVNNIPKRFDVEYKIRYSITKEERIREYFDMIDESDVVIGLSRNGKYDPITLCQIMYAERFNKTIFKIDIRQPNLTLLNHLLRVKEWNINDCATNNNTNTTNNNGFNTDMYSSLYDIH